MKWLNSEHNHINNLIEYRSNSVLSANFTNDTSLVYLVLKSNIHMKESQIAKVLGLNLENENTKNVFASIKLEIVQLTNELYNRTRVTSLLEVPLTDFKEACYIIGEHFRGIFFVPVARKVHLSTSGGNISYANLTHAINPTNFLDILPNWINESIDLSSNNMTTSEEELIEFRSRFNQMWIIALWINQEYQNIFEKNQKSTKLVEKSPKSK